MPLQLDPVTLEVMSRKLEAIAWTGLLCGRRYRGHGHRLLCRGRVHRSNAVSRQPPDARCGGRHTGAGAVGRRARNGEQGSRSACRAICAAYHHGGHGERDRARPGAEGRGRARIRADCIRWCRSDPGAAPGGRGGHLDGDHSRRAEHVLRAWYDPRGREARLRRLALHSASCSTRPTKKSTAFATQTVRSRSRRSDCASSTRSRRSICRRSWRSSGQAVPRRGASISRTAGKPRRSGSAISSKRGRQSLGQQLSSRRIPRR